MNIYNTLTRKVEKFIPNDEKNVKMYTCGPTVYNFAHIGNLRTYIFEDILEKGLNYLGYNVERVMNLTDVGHMTGDSEQGEDKMEKEARIEGRTVTEIADFYTDAFFKDLSALNIKRPNTIAKASDNVDVYIKMIEKMLNDGYAYISNGNVYFDVSKMSDYYNLSGRCSEDLMVGVRDTVDYDSNKKNQADFGLWFTLSKFQDQAMKWDSPWGVGYPGWHIECSGIASKFLGDRLDIHCGGVDNIFPHHTNEIAQSEAYLGHKWCNYWVHGEHLNDSTGKMSKSKGEFLTLSLLKSKGYDPIVYRYYCLGSHYRKVLVFSYESLDGAVISYKKLKNRVMSLSLAGDIDNDKIDYYDSRFKGAFSDDINTSNMLTVVYDVLKDDTLSDATKRFLIKNFDKVLSLSLFKETAESIDSDFEKYIVDMIEKRNIAKQNKDFEQADSIRSELLSRGVILKDTRDGVNYEIVGGDV
ncbi:MAG: cysteine--tRNA ligase [Bacilli bacterium]|nr:cysteine--tRNA ligase [Bacilli bacterium]